MVICQAKDYKDLSRKAAHFLRAQILLKPDCTLGLATGSSPLGVYEKLTTWYRKGDLDFSRVSTINLDEYRGLGPEDDQSYRFFMNMHLFRHINIDPARTFVPDGLEVSAKKACENYDRILEACGGADLQLLGLGHNGHIGFNEPAGSFTPNTHCVNLAPGTIEANRRFFASEADVPRQAYTMGIRGILSARKILLLVSGEDKADILKKAVAGPITPEVPASILQLHQDVVLIADEAALSRM